MDKQDIEKFIEEHRKFEMFDFQERFSLSYAETNKILEGLQESGVINYCEGYTYVVDHDSKKSKTERIYKPKNEQEDFLLKALWECINKDIVSTSLIQRRLSCSYAMADRAINWMEENGYIGSYPNRKVKMSAEKYIKKFGNPNKIQEESENEERKRSVEERRRQLMERLSRMTEAENLDDDDEDDNNEDDEDVDEQARREYLEKRRAELIARMQQSFNNEDKRDVIEREDADDKDEQDDKAIYLKKFLLECFERGLQEDPNDDKYILDLDGEPKFEFKFVNDGGALKISDGGKTLRQVGLSKRKVENILKSFVPVKLEGEEVFITITNPFGTLMAVLILYSATDALKKRKLVC